MNQQDEIKERNAAQGEETLTTADLAGGRDSQTIDQPAQPDAERTPTAGGPPLAEGAEPLFPAKDADELRGRWDSIQAGFVDEPRKAVQDADSLVASAMKRLAETFADERSTLEKQWDRGDDVSTEDLRVALRRYRSFFGRLLSM
jgi:hypothetical protein